MAILQPGLFPLDIVNLRVSIASARKNKSPSKNNPLKDNPLKDNPRIVEIIEVNHRSDPDRLLEFVQICYRNPQISQDCPVFTQHNGKYC